MLDEADKKFIRALLKTHAKEIIMAVTQEFQTALAAYEAAAVAKGVAEGITEGLAQAAANNAAALAAAASQAQADDLAAVDAATKALTPPAPVVVTLTPTSISGTVGTAISGQFVAEGGTGPYKFAGDGSSLEVTVAEDGTYTSPASVAASGAFDVTATDANGVASVATSVTVSIV